MQRPWQRLDQGVSFTFSSALGAEVTWQCPSPESNTPCLWQYVSQQFCFQINWKASDVEWMSSCRCPQCHLRDCLQSPGRFFPTVAQTDVLPLWLLDVRGHPGSLSDISKWPVDLHWEEKSGLWVEITCPWRTGLQRGKFIFAGSFWSLVFGVLDVSEVSTWRGKRQVGA